MKCERVPPARRANSRQNDTHASRASTHKQQPGTPPNGAGLHPHLPGSDCFKPARTFSVTFRLELTADESGYVPTTPLPRCSLSLITQAQNNQRDRNDNVEEAVARERIELESCDITKPHTGSFLHETKNHSLVFRAQAPSTIAFQNKNLDKQTKHAPETRKQTFTPSHATRATPATPRQHALPLQNQPLPAGT